MDPGTQWDTLAFSGVLCGGSPAITHTGSGRREGDATVIRWHGLGVGGGTVLGWKEQGWQGHTPTHGSLAQLYVIYTSYTRRRSTLRHTTAGT